MDYRVTVAQDSTDLIVAKETVSLGRQARSLILRPPLQITPVTRQDAFRKQQLRGAPGKEIFIILKQPLNDYVCSVHIKFRIDSVDVDIINNEGTSREHVISDYKLPGL